MKTDSSWFMVFGEDEGVEEASSCNYCVGEKGGEEYMMCTQNEPNSLVKEGVGEGGKQTPQHWMRDDISQA